MGAGVPAVAVESTLERDFALLQRFDPEVKRVEEQPVRIEYRDGNGSRRSYVPDFLVTPASPQQKSRLVEVKFSTDLQLLSGVLNERFAAARSYAAQRGWTFDVVTETDIRTPRLINATFLLPFLGRVVHTDLRRRILADLEAASSTIQALADQIAQAENLQRDAILPTLWAMIARLEIFTDLNQPLAMGSPLRLPKGEKL